MAKKSRGLAARVAALEKAVAKTLSGENAKKKKSKKASIRKATKAAKPEAKATNSRNPARVTKHSRKRTEHGIFPSSPPIFAVDEADAEAALGIRRQRSRGR